MNPDTYLSIAVSVIRRWDQKRFSHSRVIQVGAAIDEGYAIVRGEDDKGVVSMAGLSQLLKNQTYTWMVMKYII